MHPECKLDAYIASQSCKSGEEAAPGFSKAMALRRLHWKNCVLGEALYMLNIFKVDLVAQGILSPPRG